MDARNLVGVSAVPGHCPRVAGKTITRATKEHMSTKERTAGGSGGGKGTGAGDATSVGCVALDSHPQKAYR